MTGELAQTLAQGINERDSIRSEQVKQDTISNYFIIGEYRFKVKVVYFALEERSLGDAFVLGHASNAVLGTDALGIGTAGSWTIVAESNAVQFVTNTARDEVAKWLNGESADEPTHMGYGTGTTAYNISQTALVSEVQTRLTTTATNSTSKQSLLVSSNVFNISQASVTEAGLFTASSSGTMYHRAIFTAKTFDTSHWYRFSFKIELADSSIGNSMVVDEGLNEVRDFVGSVSATAPTHTEWNDATILPTAAHVAADWDSGGSNEDRNAFQTQSRAGNVITFEAILSTSELNGVSITKSGTFNASSNGNLFGQTKYGTISKTTLFQLYEMDRYIVENS